MYIYRQAKDGVKWEVGHYHPIAGQFISEGIYTTQSEAAFKVHYLNGGNAEPHTYTTVYKVYPKDGEPC